MNKTEERKAYEAGRASLRITWGDDATDRQRTPGEHHCPFPEGDEQREPWLRGLRDGLASQLDDKERATILKRIDEEIGGADDVSAS